MVLPFLFGYRQREKKGENGKNNKQVKNDNYKKTT